MALSIGFRDSVSLLPAIQATRLLTFTSVGLSPTEHTSLSWTHFRTAGFPRYGFKAGLSDGAFPATLVCHRPSCPLLPSSIPCSVSEMDALVSTSVRADLPLYPRGPRSGPGYAVPVHPHLTGPIRPTRGHIPTSPFSRLIRDAFAVHIRICLGDPRLVLSFH